MMKKMRMAMRARGETVGSLLGLFFAMLFILSPFIIITYQEATRLDYIQETSKGFYEAPHELRKMFVRENEVTVKQPAEAELSGRFFLGIGSVHGTYRGATETKSLITHVRFAWKIQDNTYTTTTLPLDKIRIKLVEEIGTPTVSFFLNSSKIAESSNYPPSDGLTSSETRTILENYYDTSEALTKYLDYVVFTVRSEDWPADINLPLNQGYDQ